MRSSTVSLLTLLVLFICLASCSADVPQPVLPTEQPDTPETPEKPNEPDNGNTMSNKLKLSVGSNVFTVSLEDNTAARTFCSLLPLTLNMSELNGNEKFHNLATNLPTAVSRPGTIHAGDLMLYGSNCLVLFYENFSSSYSYTRLGRVDNPSELTNALGTGSVTATFEISDRSEN